MTPEYVITFDGVNRGDDSDLLDKTLRIPEKKLPPAMPIRVSHRPEVLQVLETATRWLTIKEIAARAGLSTDLIWGVLADCLRRGRVVRQTRIMECQFGSVGRHRQEQLYALPGRDV
jgi:hypothetical protein